MGLLLLPTSRGLPFKPCVSGAMLHGSETWPATHDDKIRLKERCLHSSKNPHKIALKRHLMNRLSPASVNFLAWLPTFSWSGKQQLLFLKKLATGYFRNECKSSDPSEIFCSGLEFGGL